MLCGGSSRGQCRCSACICRPGYSGDSCECSLSTLECQKANGEVCSGKGKCVCNRCHCDESYAGKYCEESIYSASICERLKPCVLCMAYGKKYPSCEQCNIKVQMVDDLESSRATCFMINLGCILKYSYISPITEGDTMTVLAKKDRVCEL
ncbi:Integrin beta-4 [Armadillidium nasatum]|uniref:Integrin beta-4 n=1 Tax=Armadillidium nasatum TaxID=96803 RepID=A0A5N5SPP9_9CRUS|nr:Integrin beta-4 [Armadillidium nasatum]